MTWPIQYWHCRDLNLICFSQKCLEPDYPCLKPLQKFYYFPLILPLLFSTKLSILPSKCTIFYLHILTSCANELAYFRLLTFCLYLLVHHKYEYFGAIKVLILHPYLHPLSDRSLYCIYLFQEIHGKTGWYISFAPIEKYNLRALTNCG